MKKSVAIVGGGPAGMALASFLDAYLYDIAIYEKNKAPGRKFLVAGKGGFNLTHGEPIAGLILKYSPVGFLSEALSSFTNEHLSLWLDHIGIPTFEGSSGRIFPIKGVKPINVLNALLYHLEKKNVEILYQKEWTGWDEHGNLEMNYSESIVSDYQVFALGGGSWKVTGSDGKWLPHFIARGIKTNPFIPVNCAFQISWPEKFIKMYEGKPLKNITIRHADQIQTGEAVITLFGLEGNALYPVSMNIQHQLKVDNKAVIYLDLKPMLDLQNIVSKITSSKRKNTTDILRHDLNLNDTKIQLLKAFTTRDEFLDVLLVARRIKSLPLEILSSAPLDEAISTIGGIDLDEVSSDFELKKMAGTYCIGEMLDWYAPTGGYLLQGCFSMGYHLAHQLNKAI